MVVIIVIFGVTGDVISKWIKHRGAGNGDASAALQARIDKLEQRVRSLEEIATDDDSRLKQQINAL